MSVKIIHGRNGKLDSFTNTNNQGPQASDSRAQNGRFELRE